MNPQSPTPVTPSTVEHRTMQKTWLIAQRKTGSNAKHRTNTTVETLYTSILTKAKFLLTGSEQPVFERDYRKDRTESAFAMHCLMSDSFYFYLECNAHYDYRVEYAFYKCPFEHDIRAYLMWYPFDTHATEIVLKPDFNTFYRRVLDRQAKHISLPPFK